MFSYLSILLLSLTFYFSTANAEVLTYQGATDFNRGRGFSYLTSKGEAMTYSTSHGSMKAASEAYLLIGRGFIHPGNSADAILRFTSPGAGSLAITGRIYDLDPSCGGGTTSGVLVTVKKNATTLFKNTILNGNFTGHNINLKTTVVAGDKIDFIVNARGDWSCDSTFLDPKIVFTRAATSSAPMPAHAPSPLPSTSTAPLRTFLLDEANTLNSWSGLELNSSRSVQGKSSALWLGANGGSPAILKLNNSQTNWLGYRSISFWAYSEVNNNAEIVVGLTSPNTNGNGDYYYHSFFTNWRGWKLVKLNFKDFKASRTPYGFQKITAVAFSSKGWSWLKPKVDTKISLDRISISSSENLVDLRIQSPSIPIYNSLFEVSNPRTSADLVPKFEKDFGFRPIKIIAPAHRYDSQLNKSIELSAAEVRQSDVMLMAKKIAQQNPKMMVVIDIEHWKTKIKSPADETEVRRNIEILGDIVDWIHEAAPSLKVGYYDLIPHRDYWRPQKGANSPEYKAWQKENDYMLALSKKVDVIFPSLYTFYNDRVGWKKYAMANIAEAKRYKKPIYPFLWPQYHDSNKLLKGTRIDGDFWFMQLTTLKSLGVNGLVLWDWAYLSPGKPLYWNSNEGWWQSTLRVLFP